MTMNNFIFENSTKVFFGKGCVKEYLCCLTKAYGDTVMLCYGGGSIKKNGIYDEVTNILKAAGKTVVEFSGIMANPTYAKVLEGAKLAKKNDVSLLLGIGGGSVMDCCKAISIAARYDGDVWEDFWKRPGVFDFEPLPLGVIVTVAGTGSECNGGAVITNEELKIKTGRDYPQCNPKFALLDPTYTYSVPKSKWFPAALIFCRTLWRFISASRMRTMYRTIFPRRLCEVQSATCVLLFRIRRTTLHEAI